MPNTAALGLRVVNASNIDTLVKAIASGASFVVSESTPSGYTREFQHQDWIDFVDPVAAGGSNGFNERFHALEHEFDLIAAAITSADTAIGQIEQAPPAVGLVVAPGISNGAKIPVPSGFSVDETKFFAFPKLFSFTPSAVPSGQNVNFQVFAATDGTVTANGNNATLLATGVAIAKRGGW